MATFSTLKSNDSLFLISSTNALIEHYTVDFYDPVALHHLMVGVAFIPISDDPRLDLQDLQRFSIRLVCHHTQALTERSGNGHKEFSFANFSHWTSHFPSFSDLLVLLLLDILAHRWTN